MSPLSFFQGYFTNDSGNFQQYALVPAEISAKVSLPCSLVHAIGFESLSFDSGCRLIYHLNRLASIPLGVASAALGLYLDRADPGSKKLTAPWEGGKGQYSGQPIVVFGGSTSVGQYSELALRD